MKFPTLEDVNLEPFVDESIDHKLSTKHSLLFSKLDDVPVAIIHQDALTDGINHLSRLHLKYPIYLVDFDSFERLRNKFLEIQTGSDFDTMETTSEELFEAESDLLEFIQNSQDLLSSEESAPVIKLVNSLFFQAIK